MKLVTRSSLVVLLGFLLLGPTIASADRVRCDRCRLHRHACNDSACCDKSCGKDGCQVNHCDNCQWTTETRTVKQTIYKIVEREVQVTVPREVPVVCDVAEQYLENVYFPSTELVYAPDVRTTFGMDLRPITTMVPTKTVQGTRDVLSWYPCAIKTKIPVDYGHYECVPCEPGELCPTTDCRHGCDVQVTAVSRGVHGGGCGASCGGPGGKTVVIDFPCGGCGHCDNCRQQQCDHCGFPHHGQGCQHCGHGNGPLLTGGLSCQSRPKCCKAACPPGMRQVWVPDIHFIETTKTVMKAHAVERVNDSVSMVEPVTTFVAVPTREDVIVPGYRPRTFVDAIPVTRTRIRKGFKYKVVPETATKIIHDVVPVEVEKEVQVRVRKHDCENRRCECRR